MIQLNRLKFETHQKEKKLTGLYKECHHGVLQLDEQKTIWTKSRHLQWLSASVWLRVQMTAPRDFQETLQPLYKIREEFIGEVRAIMSDYGSLCLEGLRLLLTLLAGWQLIQEIIPLQLNLWIFSGLVLGCIILYPTGMYTFWNWGAIHPFKGLKLTTTAIGGGAAGAGIYVLSQLESQNPFFESVILSSFNMTEFLILVNVSVLLSFIILYRRANLFSESFTNYQRHFIFLSGLDLSAQEEIERLMGVLEPIPLKTHTKRRLKARIIEKYSETGAVEETWIKDFIRANCIDMNWIYWSGSIAQWTLLILLFSKLVWARDTGLMVSADYFRQELRTGMVLGALAVSGLVFYPLNRCFREILYQGSPFSLKQARLMVGLALVFVSAIPLSGLIPSRFIWGIPVNPAPHPWGFTILVGLVLLLQFFKSDLRVQTMTTEEK